MHRFCEFCILGLVGRADLRDDGAACTCPERVGYVHVPDQPMSDSTRHLLFQIIMERWVRANITGVVKVLRNNVQDAPGDPGVYGARFFISSCDELYGHYVCVRLVSDLATSKIRLAYLDVFGETSAPLLESLSRIAPYDRQFQEH